MDITAISLDESNWGYCFREEEGNQRTETAETLSYSCMFCRL